LEQQQPFYGLLSGITWVSTNSPSPPPHALYISSPYHCLLFATRAHTIATCFVLVARLCHLFLVSLSTLYLELLFFTLTSHIHLTILISAAEVPPSFFSLQASSHFHAS